jgi:hypothetical protein
MCSSILLYILLLLWRYSVAPDTVDISSLVPFNIIELVPFNKSPFTDSLITFTPFTDKSGNVLPVSVSNAKA